MLHLPLVYRLLFPRSRVSPPLHLPLRPLRRILLTTKPRRYLSRDRTLLRLRLPPLIPLHLTLRPHRVDRTFSSSVSFHPSPTSFHIYQRSLFISHFKSKKVPWSINSLSLKAALNRASIGTLASFRLVLENRGSV